MAEGATAFPPYARSQGTSDIHCQECPCGGLDAPAERCTLHGCERLAIDQGLGQGWYGNERWISMPFLGVDSWRWQYFKGQPCPADIVVPIDDATAWELYPRHRWVYDKLAICATQGLPHGPHGTTPPSFPVFSKPIYNMRGMGTGSRIIANAAEYEESLLPGHMWMPL